MHDSLYQFRTAANRYDPTHTTALRRRFEGEAARRVREFAREVNRFLFEEDSLLLKSDRVRANAFRYRNSPKKVDDFIRWLQTQSRRGLLDVEYGAGYSTVGAGSWADVYIRTAYQKGLAQAAGQMKRAGATVADRWIDAGFFRPIHADAVGLTYTRVYSELSGITRAMDSALSSTLALGMAEGLGVQAIAENINEQINGIGLVRARRLARTEIIRAHAEATLNTYEEAGLTGVQVLGEFATAGDSKVCPRCRAFANRNNGYGPGVYVLSKARGLIPVHPNCRCAWLPVIDAKKAGKTVLL